MNKRYFSFISIIFSFIICCLLISCESDSDNDNVNDDKDKCKDTPLGVEVDTNGCPVVYKIDKINLYVETSASMGGYFNGVTDFTKFFGKFLVKVDQNIANNNLSIFYISDTIRPFSGDKIQFIKTYSTTNISRSNSSPLDIMLIKIIENAKDNDVSVLVSDGIISGSDEEIRNSLNRNFNIEKAESNLMPKILNSFIKLRKNGFAVSLYGFNSTFNGKYYNYRNDSISLNGEKKRPYYFWVIAKKKILIEFNKKLNEEVEFDPLLEMHYGYDYTIVKDFHILYEKYKKGDCDFDENKVINIRVPDEINRPKPTFALAIDLSDLPLDAQKTNLLKDRITITNNYCDVKLISVTKEVVLAEDTNDDCKGLPQESHVLVFQINRITNDNANFKVQMPLVYSNDYMNWSTMNDLTKDNLDSTTFGFEHLIGGIQDAYQSKNKYYIDFTINLNR